MTTEVITKVGAFDTPYPIDEHAGRLISTDIPRSINELILSKDKDKTTRNKGFKTKVEFREPRIMPIMTSFAGGALYSLTPWTAFIGTENINIYQFSEYLTTYRQLPESRDLKVLRSIDPIELYNSYGNLEVQAKYRLLTDFRNEKVVNNFYGNIYAGEPCRICWGGARKEGKSLADKFYNSVFNGDLGARLRSVGDSFYHKFDMDMRLSMEENLKKIKPIENSVHRNIISYIIVAGVYNQLSKTKIMDLRFRYQTGVY